MNKQQCEEMAKSLRGTALSISKMSEKFQTQADIVTFRLLHALAAGYDAAGEVAPPQSCCFMEPTQ